MLSTAYKSAVAARRLTSQVNMSFAPTSSITSISTMISSEERRFWSLTIFIPLATRRLRSSPQCKVLVLTCWEHYSLLRQGLSIGDEYFFGYAPRDAYALVGHGLCLSAPPVLRPPWPFTLTVGQHLCPETEGADDDGPLTPVSVMQSHCQGIGPASLRCTW